MTNEAFIKQFLEEYRSNVIQENEDDVRLEIGSYLVNAFQSILVENQDLIEFDFSYRELEKLARIGLTTSLAVEHFLYHRFIRIKGKPFDYDKAPTSPMNEMCVKLAKQVDETRWEHIIKPTRHPGIEDCSASAARETNDRAVLFEAIFNDDMTSFLNFASVINLNQLVREYVDVSKYFVCDYKIFKNALSFAVEHEKVAIVEKIAQLLDTDFEKSVTYEYFLYELCDRKFSSLEMRCKLADILIKPNPHKILNSRPANQIFPDSFSRNDEGTRSLLDIILDWPTDEEGDFAPYLIKNGAMFTTGWVLPKPSDDRAPTIFRALSEKAAQLSPVEIHALVKYTQGIYVKKHEDALEYRIEFIIEIFQKMGDSYPLGEWKPFIKILCENGAYLDPLWTALGENFKDIIELQKSRTLTGRVTALYDAVCALPPALTQPSVSKRLGPKLKMD